MNTFTRGTAFRILLVLPLRPCSAMAQSGNAGAVRGTVTDPTGAVDSQRDRPPRQRGQRIRPHRDHRRDRPIHLLQCSLQPLPI